jgi:hypothetical protein
MSRQVRRLLQEVRALGTAAHPLLARLRADPARILSDAGMPPDTWQAAMLRSSARRFLLLCSRQAGKSQTAAALAVKVALLEAPALVLLLSPSLRQSGELFRDKVKRLYNALGRPVQPVQESALTMELANGSRIVSLPGEEETIRGYSGVRLLVVDEAARVPDDLYRAVRPMLAVSKGRLICLSTPFGKRGFFYEAWEHGGRWERVKTTAAECPRISPEFLDEERQALGPRWFAQEYLCSFEEAVDQVFLHDDVLAACSAEVQPLFAVAEPVVIGRPKDEITQGSWDDE